MNKTIGKLVAPALVVSLLILPAGVSAIAPVSPSAVQSRPRHRLRFRFSLAGTLPLRGGWSQDTAKTGSFRFPDEPLPQEAGPFPVTFQHSYRPAISDVGLGPIVLAYEWTDHLSAEFEFYSTGREHAFSGYGVLTFTSVIDDKTYETGFFSGFQVSTASFLFGLTYRLLRPTVFDRHAVEVGASAGPALFTAREPDWFTSGGSLISRKAALSARIHIAYDYYFVPSFSVGAVLGARFLEANFPVATPTLLVSFTEVGVSPPPYLERMTEITIPERKASISGAYFCLRLGVKL